MKIILLLISVVIINFCQAQSKGDNTILVKGVTFDNVVNSLLEKGFRIDKIDKDFHTVRTEKKQPNSKYSIMVVYDVWVKDNIAVIKGKVEAANSWEDIEFNDKFIYKESFNYMSNFAQSLNGEIQYLKKD